MKSLLYILAILSFISCGKETNQQEELQVDGRARELNDSAIKLAMTFDKDKLQKAVELFDQATQIQPDYYLAHWNKMVYQNQLGQTKEAFETLKLLEELCPEDPGLKMAAGIFLELNVDSIQARQKFLEAEELYKSILDTLTDDPQQITLTNRAVNLKFLGQENKANKVLLSVKENQTDQTVKEMIGHFMSLDRKQLMENFKTVK